ncbi:hypothetical protein [Luteimicrobium album]|nr:hypothetical protein [Luteimicrobium album]
MKHRIVDDKGSVLTEFESPDQGNPTIFLAHYLHTVEPGTRLGIERFEGAKWVDVGYWATAE